MKRMKAYFDNCIKSMIANFALAYAGGSVKRICFYIFHQPKMPEEVLSLKNDIDGKVS